uniref:Uncharacterized protein n=1 Tax=Anser cygnoides TaxID=8845 RepID=A0A8B9DBY0_ANSCY
MLEKKTKSFSISMPKPIERNSRNQGKKIQSFPLEFIENNNCYYVRYLQMFSVLFTVLWTCVREQLYN